MLLSLILLLLLGYLMSFNTKVYLVTHVYLDNHMYLSK